MATAAEPILASSLWLAERTKGPATSTSPADRHHKLQTGVKAIDTAFKGGLDFGSVHCITSEAGHGATDFMQGFLASHLLSSTRSSATVIDATLSFDVRKLFEALKAASQDAEEASQAAMKTLDRLNIMKVFDYVGLNEAVAEVRESIEAGPAELAEGDGTKVPKATIEDSEDEGEDLINSPSPAKATPAAGLDEGPPSRLLIIDNLFQLMAPLIKNNYAQGQASLSAFMRSLRHLTRSHDLCTVVLGHASGKAATEEESLSMFKSCTIRPALGNGIGQLADMHMYLHRLPRKSASEAPSKASESVSVIEVVQDRYGNRYGHWAPFETDATGRLKDLA